MPGPAGDVVHAHDRAVGGRAGGRSAPTSPASVFHGSSRLRSTTSTSGQLVPLVVDRPGAPSRSPTAASPTTVGHGDTSSTGAPARRARSTTTSRACHVGLRSSCSASSCSSRTTTAARSGHGAHAATRDPMTTSTPAAAAAHSCGHTATLQPGPAQPDGVEAGPVGRRHDDQRRPAPGGGQQRPAARRRSAGSAQHPAPGGQQAGGVGARRFGPARPCAGSAAARRRSSAGWPSTRNGRSRPAAQRTDAHRASSITPAVGPRELTFAIGRIRSIVERTDRPGRARRPSRRPAARAAAPAPRAEVHVERRASSGRGSRTPCRAR